MLLYVCLFHLALESIFEIEQEAEFCASDLCGFDELDFGDDRGVDRVDLFHADAVADFSSGHGAADASTTQAEDDSFKDLNAFSRLTFWRDVDDALVDADGLSGFEFVEAYEFGFERWFDSFDSFDRFDRFDRFDAS